MVRWWLLVCLSAVVASVPAAVVVGAPSMAEERLSWFEVDESAGYALYESGDYLGAIASFRKVLEGEPANDSAHEGLVWSYLALGDMERAAAAADDWRAVGANPTAVLTWAEIAIDIDGREQAALEAYREVLSHYETDAAVRMYFGSAFARAGLFEEAEAEYEAAVALAGTPEAWFGLVETRSARGDWEGSSAALDELIGSDPQDVGLLVKRAEIALDMDRLGAAGIDLHRALTLSSHNARGQALLARGMEQAWEERAAGDAEAAAAYFGAVQKHHPDAAKGLAWSLIRLEEWDEAEAAADRWFETTARSPANVREWTNMRAGIEQGRDPCAAPAPVRRDPQASRAPSPPARVSGAPTERIAREEESDPRAGSATGPMTEPLPPVPRASWETVWKQMSERDLKEAGRTLEDMVDRDPRDGEAILFLGRVAHWRGHPHAARQYLSRSADLLSDGRPQASRALVELQRGRMAAAHRALLEAEALGPELAETVAAAEQLDRALSPRVSVTQTYTVERDAEAPKMIRMDTVLGTERHLVPGSLLGVDASWTHFADRVGRLDRFGVGAGLTQELPADFGADLRYRVDLVPRSRAQHSVAFTGVYQPAAVPVRLQASLQHRPWVDRGLTIEDPFLLRPLVGSSGMYTPGIREGLSGNELILKASTGGIPGGFAYAQGSLGLLSDGNSRRTGGAGLGIDVLAVRAYGRPHALTFKYGFQAQSFSERGAGYFSPERWQAHRLSSAWRWHGRRGFVAVEGGAALQPERGTQYSLGGAVGVHVGSGTTLRVDGSVIRGASYGIAGAALSVEHRP